MNTKLAIALLGSCLLSGAAFAQTATPPRANDAKDRPAATSNERTTNATTAATTTTKDGVYPVRQGEWRSTKLIHLDVYNNNNDKVGDIKELIVDQNGQIKAVVVGAGGFLGMGEHDVAIPYQQVRFEDEARRATTTDRVASNNASSTNTTRTDAGGGKASTTIYRGYPDHAVVNMTKDQLKALPEVRYAR